MKLKDILRPAPPKKAEGSKTGLSGHFRPVSSEELAGTDGALLQFWRERCFRGNARRFRIMMDGRELGRIANEETFEAVCPPGIHQFYLQLDGMKSPVVNLKAGQGLRYAFHIRCTMEEGLYLAQVDLPEKQEE